MPKIQLRFLLIVFSFLLCVSESTSAMDFSWEVKGKGPDVLLMSGEIKLGDGERFRQFMRSNFNRYKTTRWVRLASPGGNLIEALQIASVLRAMFSNVTVEVDKCASSCFFLYLSGVNRYAKPASLLGIHRAFFDPSYFGGLSPREAESQQNQLKVSLNKILDESDVPQYLRERMNSTSSANVYWLNESDVENIGRMPAWFEELLIAKCKYGEFLRLDKEINDSSVDTAKRISLRDQYLDSYIDAFVCESRYIEQQLKKEPEILDETVKRSRRR